MGRIALFWIHSRCDLLFWCFIATITFTLFLLCEIAIAVEIVPNGNRNSVQPAIPKSSLQRTNKVKGNFEEKYQKIYTLLQNDIKLQHKIKSVAKDYKIDPVHIVGAIIGEHTYNVDVLDQLQSYYVKGMSWASQNIVFAYQGEKVSRFVARPQFNPCQAIKNSNQLWACREDVWNKQFRGKKIEGKSYPDKRFSAVFFQPFFAGQTFGLGQLNPLTALMMTDLVHKISALPKLSADNGRQVYRTIMDPDSTLPYIAATIRQSIDDYHNIADFDISQNPGLTATLYNIGGSAARARALWEENQRRKTRGEALLYPQENYYGWLVNNKLDDLQKLFTK